jgi:hypothetical protein|tara:strand:+ start:159 stop:509 length:351 start_codon:yes stop_codon:yes gene_type:complete
MEEQIQRVDPVIRAKVHQVPASTSATEWVDAKLDPDEKRKFIKVKCGSKIFKVDVPMGFFDEDGDYVAKPDYEVGEILHVKWTGYANKYGFIDTNVRGRGRGGGGGGDGGDCAKWS